MKRITIHVDEKKEIRRQGDLFGIFFEDLNHAADGGLYGELIRNRSFAFDRVDCEGYHSMTAWEVVQRGDSVAAAHVETAEPLCGENPNHLTLEVIAPGEGGGVRNLGYAGGIPVRKGENYRFSCWYRLRTKGEAAVQIRLEDESGKRCLSQKELILKERTWACLDCVLTAEETEDAARLAILSREPVILELDYVSLFPENTGWRRERIPCGSPSYGRRPAKENGSMRFPGRSRETEALRYGPAIPGWRDFPTCRPSEWNFR